MISCQRWQPQLVDLRVAVLFAAGGPPSALAAKAAIQSIPVVFSAVTDPVRLGLVASLNKPASNVTGMSLLTSETFAKSTQLLKELLPTASVIAYLVNPSSPTAELYDFRLALLFNHLVGDGQNARRYADIDPKRTSRQC